MAYVRLSIVVPSKGKVEQVESVMRKIAEAAKAHSGCTQSYLMRAHDSTGEVARVAVYSDEAAADRAAQDGHVMALRSELHLLIEPGHTERGFSTI